MNFPFSLDNVCAARAGLGDKILTTPVHRWKSLELGRRIGDSIAVNIKLELFQYTNSFKPRGALTVMLNAPQGKLQNGVVAVSGGNHGIAVAYAAHSLNVSAKILIPRKASPVRIKRMEEYGADVILVDSFMDGFEKAKPIEENENRLLVHPYEGPMTALGTATLALEWFEQVSDMDAVIVPIGGGGLIGGMAACFKQLNPKIKIYGVEPFGADSIARSLRSGHLEKALHPQTIADSLATPEARPYSLSLVKNFVDEVALISDDAMRDAMALLFNDMKIVAEPACAAATAGLLGPYAKKLRGKRVGVIACGSNIDIASFSKEIIRSQMA